MKSSPVVCTDEVHAIAPDVRVWGAFDPACKTDLASTLYRTAAGRLLLVDPIRLVPEAADELRDWGEPAAVLLTNGNHDRASVWWAERWGVPRVSHPQAAGEFATSPDERFDDGDLLEGELRIIALPGAGPGEVALYHEPTGTATFGDALINLPGYECAPLPDKYCADPKLARRSLKRFAALEVSRITFGHGWPLVSGAGARLRALCQTVRD